MVQMGLWLLQDVKVNAVVCNNIFGTEYFLLFIYESSIETNTITRWWQLNTFLEFSTPIFLGIHDPFWRSHIFQMSWLGFSRLICIDDHLIGSTEKVLCCGLVVGSLRQYVHGLYSIHKIYTLYTTCISTHIWYLVYSFGVSCHCFCFWTMLFASAIRLLPNCVWGLDTSLLPHPLTDGLREGSLLIWWPS